MSKAGYYEYDPIIYPRKLWVHIGKDIKEVASVAFENVQPSEEEYYGITYSGVVRKDNQNFGILVSFKSGKDMTMGVCAHEASHVCDDIEEAVGMEHGGEASAYLLGWIASCMNNARLGHGDFIEVVKNKK